MQKKCEEKKRKAKGIKLQRSEEKKENESEEKKNKAVGNIIRIISDDAVPDDKRKEKRCEK
jgi:hypothetical protein